MTTPPPPSTPSTETPSRLSTLTVSVVVVTWEAVDLTLRCLESLRAQGLDDGLDVRLVVVDNGSTDGTVRALADTPDVQVVALPTNVGFAAGANAGIAATDSDVVVLLNNDAVARPGFLRALVEPFRTGTDPSSADPSSTDPSSARLAATTGRVLLRGRFVPARRRSDGTWADDVLVGHDGTRWSRTVQHLGQTNGQTSGQTSAQTDERPGVLLVNSTGNEVTTSGNGRDRDWLTPADRPGTADAAATVFGFNGGCAALSRAALADVGGFEESLFLYYEDTELSWRLRRRGWTVRHVPDAVTVHDHAASSGTSSAFFQDHNERNRLLVALVHAPWPVVVRALARTVARTLRGPDRGRRLRTLGRTLRRVPWALRRRRAVDRAAVVPRAVPAALLVPDGGPRGARSHGPTHDSAPGGARDGAREGAREGAP